MQPALGQGSQIVRNAPVGDSEGFCVCFGRTRRGARRAAGCVWPGLSRPLLLDVRLGLGVAPQGRRQVPRLVDDLGRSWMEFTNRPKTRASARFSRFRRVALPWGLGGVTVGVGWRYRGGGERYYGAFGLPISHFPLAYSLTAQPTDASSPNAFRAVCRRVLTVFGFVATSGQM